MEKRDKSEQVTIIIPAKDESLRICVLLEEIRVFRIKNPDVVGKVIVVDDGSRDATSEIVMRYSTRIPLLLIRNSVNKGKWFAILCGLGAVERGPVLLLDADGSASVWELERTGVPEKGVAIFGSRFHKQSSVDGKSVLRTVVSYGYRAYVKMVYWMCGGMESVQDFQCPYKLFWKEDVVKHVRAERFAGDVGLTLALDAAVKNAPIRFVHKAGSKLPISAIWTMFWETLVVAVRTSRSKRLC